MQSLRRGFVLALILSVAGNALLFFAAERLDVPFTVGGDEASQVGWPAVVTLSMIAVLMATAVLWWLKNALARPYRSFLWLAGGLAAFSLLVPYFMADHRATFAALGLMHILSAVVIVYQLGVRAP